MNLPDSLEKRTTALTASDVAKVLNISVRQVYSLAAGNTIPHFKIGGSIRFEPTAFAAWFRQRMATTVMPSNGRNYAKKQPVLRRLPQATPQGLQAYPQNNVPIRPSSRRKSGKKRTASQNQYQFSFGSTGSPLLGGGGNEQRPSDFQQEPTPKAS
jgi:excisionase family DNA binding protein